MFRYLTLAFAVAIFALPACTEKKEPEPAAERTVRERAQAVGKFGDKTMTNHLEKDLVGIVDAAEERAQNLEDQPED
jgi:hypothetical protein